MLNRLNLLFILLAVVFILPGCLGGWLGGSYGFSYETRSEGPTRVWSPNQEKYIRAKKEIQTEHVFVQDWGNWGPGGYETHRKSEKVTLDPAKKKRGKTYKFRLTYPD